MAFVGSGAQQIEDFKIDCAAKNGTFRDLGDGSYRCEYLKYQ
jgi:hypothetical protein